MNKSLRLAAVTVIGSLLIATSAVAQSTQCQGGANLLFVGVGSSAQINALAYAATSLLTANHGSYGLISFKSSTITDSRENVTDTGLTTFVAWDPSTAGGNKCDAYVYFQTDSGVGVKDFFSYEKYTATAGSNINKHYTSVAAAYATLPALPIAKANVIPGLSDNSTDANGVPSNLQIALNNTPTTLINNSASGAPTYCGNVSTVISTSQYYCYFNAAGTDIRPEDALYATTRALTSYNGIVPPATHGGTLTGLGYSTTPALGIQCGTTVSGVLGCPFLDSFSNGGGSSSTFNVVKFALSGVDPIKGGSLPSYTTLSVGAVPVVVLAGNEDTSNLGQTYTDPAGNTNYTYNDINREALSQVFSGFSGCLADIQSGAAGSSTTGATVPLQIIHREAMSGTYNTFEFTGVRTYAGGGALNTATPQLNADNGQEQFNDPNVFPGQGTCTYGGTYGGHNVAANIPQANCFDPLFLSRTGDSVPNIKVGANCTGSSTGAPGIPVRLRAIGTGEEVKAVIGTFNTFTQSGATVSAGLATVYNPLGYSFWGFGNLGPLCGGAVGTTCTGAWKGHYLTVDGIDPLFATEGGEFDPTPNPSGPYNVPVCSVPTGGTANCPAVPFTHIKDGKYPLWSLLRTVTFAPVAGKVVIPTAVYDMIANEEKTSATDTLSDYVPFLTGISGSNGSYTGNLNLFVFRSHFKPTGIIVQNNGHIGCSTVPTGTTGTFSFTGVNLQGGKSSATTCLVDFGGDVGGTVLTVQQDVDFNADFGAGTVLEEYGLRQ